jgi:hypothetical protein
MGVMLGAIETFISLGRFACSMILVKERVIFFRVKPVYQGLANTFLCSHRVITEKL